jgi:hypothetical protein
MYDGIAKEEAESTWIDWKKRVQHKYFGLGTFFITQNGAAKGGIRLGPTVKSLVESAVSSGSNNAEVSIFWRSICFTNLDFNTHNIMMSLFSVIIHSAYQWHTLLLQSLDFFLRLVNSQ